MSWSDLIRLLSRSWLLLVGFAVVFGVAAAVTLVEPPAAYVSTSQIASANQARAATFAQFARTEAVLGPAAQRAGVSITVEELAGRVSTQTSANSAVFSVSVSADNPETAQALGIAVTDALLEEIRSFEASAGVTVDPVRLIQPAGPGVRVADNSSPGVRVIGGMALGTILGFMLVCLRFVVGLPVRNEKEFAAFAGLPVIGNVEDARGAASVVDGPGLTRNLAFLSAGGRRAYAVVDSVPDRSAESVAFAVAQALADDGDRVVLLGLEPGKCRLAVRLGCADSPGISDTLAGLVPLEQAIRRGENSSFAVIPAGSTAPNATELLRLPAASDVMGRLEHEFDVILATGSVGTVAGSGPLFDASLVVGTPRDTTDRELWRAITMLSASSPAAGLVVREPGRRGPRAWWSRVRRRFDAGRRS